MRHFLFVFVIAILFFSCSKKNDACNYDACAISAPASEVTQVESYLSSAGITTATKHCSGMYYSIDAVGSGNTPTICSYVSVKYKGMLTNGNIFDQSTSPVSFQLGGLIEAWKKGIPLIKPGGKVKLYCPPSLAYGSQVIKDGSGNVVIPANSVLIFEVDLVAVSN